MPYITKIKLATASEIVNQNIAIAGIQESEIIPGSSQRLCIKGKNTFMFFWIKVEVLANGIFIGKISQNLSVKGWGINIGDLIEFKLDNIVKPYINSFRDF